jgi:hypothetical protein
MVRSEWLQALDRIESLHPNAVVVGHGAPDPDGSTRYIGETRCYLHGLNACVTMATPPLEIYERTLSSQPNQVTHMSRGVITAIRVESDRWFWSSRIHLRSVPIRSRKT